MMDVTEQANNNQKSFKIWKFGKNADPKYLNLVFFDISNDIVASNYHAG